MQTYKNTRTPTLKSVLLWSSWQQACRKFHPLPSRTENVYLGKMRNLLLRNRKKKLFVKVFIMNMEISPWFAVLKEVPVEVTVPSNTEQEIGVFFQPGHFQGVFQPGHFQGAFQPGHFGLMRSYSETKRKKTPNIITIRFRYSFC